MHSKSHSRVLPIESFSQWQCICECSLVLKVMLMDSEMQTLHEMYFDAGDNKMLLVLTPKIEWAFTQWDVKCSLFILFNLIFSYSFQNPLLTVNVIESMLLNTLSWCWALAHIHRTFQELSMSKSTNVDFPI